jgi:glyceraldehyde 3-phosphate dehydrogenase
MLNTTHAVTASQKPVDGNSEKFANGYGCIDNIVVTDTGASRALQKIIPGIKNVSGISCRVPVTDGSILASTMVFDDLPSGEEITEDLVLRALKDFEKEHPLNLRVSHRDTLVSSYLVGRPCGSIVAPSQIVVIGNIVIVIAGYDNEYGYAFLLMLSALRAPLPK